MARRSTGPKWYESRQAYFITINGETHNLGPDLGAANRRYAELTLRAPTTKPDLTFRELVDLFIADKNAEWKPKTTRIWGYMLRRFAKKYGDTKAIEMIPYHATSFRAEQEDWSNGTARIFYSALKGCFEWATQQGLFRDNPLRGLKRPRLNTRDDSCLVTLEQHRLIMAAAPTALQDLLEALWHTGQRPGAIRTVEASEVKGDKWELGDKPGRKLKRITVYLNEPMQAMTARLVRANPAGPIFRNAHGTPWRENSFMKSLSKAKKAANCHHVTAYSYRHSFGRRALDAGVNIADLAILMNTSVAWIEKTYGHHKTLTERLRSALKQVG